MYLTATHPDIVFSVSMVSRFFKCPKKSHWEATKRILRYVSGTSDHGLYYKRVNNSSLIGYNDSDWGRNLDDSKSTSGFVFFMGSGAISWQSKKQKVVALSTTKAEYISLYLARCQVVWLRRILAELTHPQLSATKILCDNRSAIAPDIG
ncbi:secreted RxLR effector protein 161-like [Rutidosis leptorrhynchoides]|uniref:secreted RxLR effector protein 161-like n=1 Tax=Rutidosis leptorrhynchoides TaxID=125765 RepID=UPI003A99C81D